MFDYGRSLLFNTAEDLLYKWEDYDFVAFTDYRDFGLKLKDILPTLSFVNLRNLDIDNIVMDIHKAYNNLQYKSGYEISEKYFEEITKMLKRGVELYEQKWN